ncbi:MAG: hypothetical protein KJO35_03230, partial [Gammaproteobacteria bacterium]|nr:hypothetical protein [Gammaproteobacteria bacterium]
MNAAVVATFDRETVTDRPVSNHMPPVMMRRSDPAGSDPKQPLAKMLWERLQPRFPQTATDPLVSFALASWKP